MTNYIALRESPDWLNFDMERSRPFLRRIGFQEDLVVDYAKEWQRVFGSDFRNFRHEMKLIAIESIRACRDCTLISVHSVLPIIKDEDLVLFIDDDDWVSPHLFEIIRDHPGNQRNGFLWGSVFIGKFLADTPDIPVGSPVIVKRRIDDTVYTNNYIASGHLLRRAGLKPLQEHFDAQSSLGFGFNPNRMTSYLSCANKHPCCTVYIKRNSAQIYERNTLRETLEAYSSALDAVEFDHETHWMTSLVDKLKTTVANVLSGKQQTAPDNQCVMGR